MTTTDRDDLDRSPFAHALDGEAPSSWATTYAPRHDFPTWEQASRAWAVLSEIVHGMRSHDGLGLDRRWLEAGAAVLGWDRRCFSCDLPTPGKWFRGEVCDGCAVMEGDPEPTPTACADCGTDDLAGACWASWGLLCAECAEQAQGRG